MEVADVLNISISYDRGSTIAEFEIEYILCHFKGSRAFGPHGVIRSINEAGARNAACIVKKLVDHYKERWVMGYILIESLKIFETHDILLYIGCISLDSEIYQRFFVAHSARGDLRVLFK